MGRWLKRLWGWPGIALIALIVLGGLWVARLNHAAPVTVATAHVGDLRLRIAASGLAEAESSDLGFQGTGELVSLYVSEGEPVVRGQTLARMEPVSSLLGGGEGQDSIHAPYDGSVVTLYAREGAVLQAGQPVLRVVAARGGWITAFLDSEDAMYVSPGDTLRCRAGGYLSKPWDVRVETVGQEAVVRQDMPGSSRQVRVRLRPASGGLPVPPGTEVDVDGDVTVARGAVLIPTAAVVRDGPDDYVWLVAQGTVHRRKVQLGPNNFAMIAIREGLRWGDTVVVDGKQDLAEGARVRAQPMPPMTETTREDD